MSRCHGTRGKTSVTRGMGIQGLSEVTHLLYSCAARSEVAITSQVSQVMLLNLTSGGLLYFQ